MSTQAQRALNAETNATQPDETCVTADTRSGTMLMMSRGMSRHGDQTITAHLAVIVCVETQRCPKAQNGVRRTPRHRVDQRMDKLVDDDEPRKRK